MAASQADTIPTMTGFRLIGGIGFGAAFPNSLALTSEWLPERWRPYAITTLSVGTPAGGSVAAALAPDLLAAYGWRGTFVAFGLATFLLIFLVLAVLRDSPPFLHSKGQKDRARRYARKVITEEFTFSAEHAAHVANGGEKAPEAIDVFHSSNRRLNWGIGISFAASTLVAHAIISWGTTFLTTAGLTLDEALTAGFAVGIASIAGALAAGYLARRFGSKAVMQGVSIAVLLAIVALAMLLEWFGVSPQPSLRFAIQTLVASVSGIVSIGIATIYVMMTLGYAQTCRSASIGFGMFTGRLGAILASFGGGYLIDLGAAVFCRFSSSWRWERS